MAATVATSLVTALPASSSHLSDVDNVLSMPITDHRNAPVKKEDIVTGIVPSSSCVNQQQQHHNHNHQPSSSSSGKARAEIAHPCLFASSPQANDVLLHAQDDDDKSDIHWPGNEQFDKLIDRRCSNIMLMDSSSKSYKDEMLLVLAKETIQIITKKHGGRFFLLNRNSSSHDENSNSMSIPMISSSSSHQAVHATPLHDHERLVETIVRILHERSNSNSSSNNNNKAVGAFAFASTASPTSTTTPPDSKEAPTPTMTDEEVVDEEEEVTPTAEPPILHAAKSNTSPLRYNKHMYLHALYMTAEYSTSAPAFEHNNSNNTAFMPILFASTTVDKSYHSKHGSTTTTSQAMTTRFSTGSCVPKTRTDFFASSSNSVAQHRPGLQQHLQPPTKFSVNNRPKHNLLLAEDEGDTTSNSMAPPLAKRTKRVPGRVCGADSQQRKLSSASNNNNNNNNVVQQRKLSASNINKMMNVKAAAAAMGELISFDADSLPRGITVRPSGKWQAQIYFAGQSRYLGVYTCREDASIAYQVALSYLNNLRKLVTTKGEEATRIFASASMAAKQAILQANQVKKQGGKK